MPLPLIVVGLFGLGALIQGCSILSGAATGERVALEWCADCHQVAPRLPVPQVDGPPPPTFSRIANDASKDDAYLRRFMGEQHLPMPTFRLTEKEKQDLLAYIRSLRGNAG